MNKPIPWKELNGRKVREARFQDGEEINSIEHTLILSVEYLGDRDEVWIVHMEGDKEIGRHNCRFIESIVWEE